MEIKKVSNEAKKFVSSKVLFGIRAAEESLARQESKEMESSLPPGHPLRTEIDKMKAAIGGDLSDLPPGHPLLKQLQVAKDSFLRIQEQEAKQKESQPSLELRKAKKLKDQKGIQARQERARQEEIVDGKQIVADTINRHIDEVLLSVRKLYEIMSAKEELLSDDSMNRAKLLRLKRLLYATEQGLTGSRMGRINNG